MKHPYQLLALFAVLCLLLSACRNSPVLVQEVYVQDAQEIDKEQEMMEPEDDGEEDEDFQNEIRENLDTKRDNETNEGLSGNDNTVNNAADVQNGNTNLQGYDKPNQSAPNGAAPNGSGNGQNGNASKPTEGNNTTPSDDGGQNNQNNQGNQGEPLVPQPSTPQYRQIVDATGEYVQIPENVTSCTATGVAAQMVAMLGAPEVLLGADEQFISSPIAGSIGVSAQAWWSGSGADGISDDSFAALLAAKPQVSFVISGQATFTEGQLQQLREADIALVTLYGLSTVEALPYNAKIIGQALNNEAKADAYVSWVNGVISHVDQATSGYANANMTSLYICAWDDSAVYEIANQGFRESVGSGLAVAYSPAKSQLISSYMNAAHVANQSTEDAGLHRSKNYVYVAPMFHNLSVTVYGEMGAYYTGEYGAAYDLFISRRIGSTYYQLGCNAYNSIIVADESVKSAIENNWYWQPHETNARGYVEINGQEFYCGVIGNYGIYVNPHGRFGYSWADASVESPLEAYWVAAKVLGVYAMDDVKAQTVSFFADFYGVTLSNDMLYAIFGE